MFPNKKPELGNRESQLQVHPKQEEVAETNEEESESIPNEHFPRYSTRQQKIAI